MRAGNIKYCTQDVKITQTGNKENTKQINYFMGAVYKTINFVDCKVYKINQLLMQCAFTNLLKN